MNEITGGTLTTVPGIRVGHWTNRDAMTGCTVIVVPEPNVIAGEVRGAAPGSREHALLAPGMTVEQIHAILLTGGSAFGLAAADGVMAELEAAGRGHPTAGGVVPIVPAAVLYDLTVGDASIRPSAADGATAFHHATADPVEQGLVGAGTGATVSKWRGLMQPGGLGSAAVAAGDAVVSALVVANALGDVFTLEGEPLTGGPPIPRPPPDAPGLRENTTLVAVVTDAGLTRSQLQRVAVRSQDALAACLRPAHTRFDGDTCFAVSCGEVDASEDHIGEAAFAAVGRALAAAVTAAGSD